MSKELDTFSRRSIILKKLNFETSKSVFSLSKECKVSLATIRRDLNVLEKDGLLIRTHGGATLKSSASNQRFATRENISKAIEKIDIKSKARFKMAFEEVSAKFERIFPIIFGGTVIISQPNCLACK